jgi:uncharacterized protein (DUF2236 family)
MTRVVPDARIGGVSRRINGERLALIGWGRAILMQLAHPLIAQGVADHSDFASASMASLHRLRHTIGAMLALTFGEEAEARAVIARIRAVHDRVHGTLDAAAGRRPRGTPYTAHDPALLLWVHVTLVDSSLTAYERFIAPLAPAIRDEYCLEAIGVAVELGARREDIPRTADAAARYIDDRLSSGEVAPSPLARALAARILHPPAAWAPWPVGVLHRLTTIGQLPPSLRAAYGLEWSPRSERLFRLVAAASRGVRPALPSRVARFAAARSADRAAGGPAPAQSPAQSPLGR